MASKLKAVVIAGGRGTRLRPFTDSIPKPMMLVNGKPFLLYLLENLKGNGILDFVFCVGYLGEQIEEYFGGGGGFGCHIEYAHEKEPLGTGGALKNAAELVGDRFLALNGDTFLDMRYDLLVETEFQEPILMVVTSNGFNDKNALCSGDRVLAFGDGAGIDSNASDAGVYVLSRDVVTSYPDARFSFEQDILSAYARTGRIRAFPVEERFYDIGTPSRVREFEDYVRTTSK